MNCEDKNSPIKSVYQNLTGIQVDEQLKTWDARGKGYYGEYLLFSELYRNLSGQCKILMNLQIPSEHGRTTEIDLLLIHETGLYVFEAKHYKGTIYGKVDDQQWTQYFRTSPNQYFNNPIIQNRWHIKQLYKICSSLPIHSFIVFTNEDCKLNVRGQIENTTLCYQRNMRRCFETVCQSAVVSLTSEKIDEVFRVLSIYSPMRKVSVINSGVALNFYQFIQQMSTQHSVKMQELEQTYAAKEKTLQQDYIKKEKITQQKLRMTKGITIGLCVAVMFLSMIINGIVMASYEEEKEKAIAEADSARKELQEFAEKWEVVTDFKIDGNVVKKDFILVDNVELKSSGDFEKATKLSYELTHNGEDFYVLIDNASMFTIVLHDGSVKEFPCYTSAYQHYALGYSSNTKTLSIKEVEFSGFSREDVKCIKLTNLKIKRIKYTYGEDALLDDYEILLYLVE